MERNELIKQINILIKKVNELYSFSVHLDCSTIDATYISIEKSNKIVLDYIEELDLNNSSINQLKDVYKELKRFVDAKTK